MAINHTHGVISDNKDWFHYSGYTKTWERVLVRQGQSQGFLKQISIPITPENNDWESLWTNRSIRVYNYVPHPNDIFTHILPDVVYEGIVANMGFERALFMIDVDIMRHVNLTKLVNINGTSERYVKVGVDGYGDRTWLRTLKTFSQFYVYPPAQKVKPSQDKLKVLSNKFNTRPEVGSYMTPTKPSPHKTK